MTNGPNRILDDFAKLLTDAAGAAQGLRKEVESGLRAQMERMLNSMDVVQRDEFEAVRQMAVKTREENAALTKRLEALEKKLDGKPATGKAKSARKPAAKAPSKK
jgi:BMFP domain-containing protein YqiC